MNPVFLGFVASLAAGSVAELAIYPGACHGFVSIDFPQRGEAVTRMEQFLGRYVT